MNFSNSSVPPMTAETILRDVERIRRELYAHRPFGGAEIRVSEFCDNVPRMMPNPAFANLMPEQFVAELRDWMRQFFGTEDKIYSIDNGRTILCGPKTMRKLREVSA